MNELYFVRQEFQEDLVDSLRRKGFFKVVEEQENYPNQEIRGELHLGVYNKKSKAAIVRLGYDAIQRVVFISDFQVTKKRRGHGRKIVSSLEEVSRDYGFSEINLISRDESRIFWEAMGYTFDNNLRMTKRLGQN